MDKENINKINSLLREAEELGIINIDVDDDHLSPEVLEAAIGAAKRINTRLDRDREKIRARLQKVDSFVAARYR